MTRPLPRLLILLALIALAGCKAEDSSPIAPGTGGTDAGGSTTVGPGTDVDLSGGQDVPALPKQCDLAIDCPAERPFCDLASGQCLECLDDSSCSAAAKCEGGTCVLQASCIPGEKTCNGEELWTCKADGSGWDTQPCPSVCFALGEARCLECEPGSK